MDVSGFSTISMADLPYLCIICSRQRTRVSAMGKFLSSSFLQTVYCVHGGEAIITSGRGHRLKSKERTSAIYSPGPVWVGFLCEKRGSISIL